MILRSPPDSVIQDLIRTAFWEDLGRAGDLTTDAIVPDDANARARFAAREDGVIAGLNLAVRCLLFLDPGLELRLAVADGDLVAAGTQLATVEGQARAILTGERTALNFLGHLSGIATATRRIVDAISHTNTRVVDTRKTTPGLRVLEKYAVRAGGGSNHRFGLDDAVLIKDNHLALVGGVVTAVERAREQNGHLVKIELEVDDLEQLDEALHLGVDVILLDNMSPSQLREAVRRTAGQAILEASGGITIESAPAIAETGVDLISVGWLTQSAPALDVGLDLLV